MIFGLAVTIKNKMTNHVGVVGKNKQIALKTD